VTTPLNAEQLGELVSIDKSEQEIGHPLSLWQGLEKDTTGQLVKLGFITWNKGGYAWGSTFREVGVTDAGRAYLESIPEAKRERAYARAVVSASREM
jgi:hypothetical protein